MAAAYCASPKALAAVTRHVTARSARIARSVAYAARAAANASSLPPPPGLSGWTARALATKAVTIRLNCSATPQLSSLELMPSAAKSIVLLESERSGDL